VTQILHLAALFQTPVVPTNAAAAAAAVVAAAAAAKSPVAAAATAVGFACASPRPQMQSLPTGFAATSQTSLTPTSYVSTTPHMPLTPLPCRSASPIVPVTSVSASASSTTFRQSPSPNTSLPYATTHSPNVLQVKTYRSIEADEIGGKSFPRSIEMRKKLKSEC